MCVMSLELMTGLGCSDQRVILARRLGERNIFRHYTRHHLMHTRHPANGFRKAAMLSH